MRFTTTVELGGKTATGLPVPDEVVEQLGGGRRPPVELTVNGYTYRSTVARMGETFVVPLSRDHREAAGVAAGDEVEVDITLDESPREVDLPDDLSAAIDKDIPARTYFDSLSFTHRKELARWVTEAKRPETRQRRIEQAVAMLAEQRHR